MGPQGDRPASPQGRAGHGIQGGCRLTAPQEGDPDPPFPIPASGRPSGRSQVSPGPCRKRADGFRAHERDGSRERKNRSSDSGGHSRGLESGDGSVFQEKENRPHLTEAQKAALSAIRGDLTDGREAVHLIHGVTGSGKTEVYLRAVQETLSLGRTALVLVPEISLTPQTVGRFCRRFGGRVAVLHSALSPAERYDQWRTIREGGVQIVIGARSAVFAPLENLGLIVVDEEHEGSYKQGNSPRYEARQVARQRIKKHKAVLVLGSATPSVESYFKGLTKELPVSHLPERIGGRPLPSVSIVDMRAELNEGNKSIFSALLSSALEGCISRKEQVILFLNRRGFATFVLCRECGAGIKCRFCAVSLTFHQEDRSLRCHHCDYRTPAPRTCPKCGSTFFRQFGTGTERVLEEFSRRFPGVPCARLDRDAARKKGAHGKILGAFERKEVQVLIGTQMIAKGLDFPGVALVGVISADTLLHLPDFRASERTYQLLTQVSGRAGRGEVPGQVVIQTYEPEHPALTAVFLGEEERFYEEELRWREELGYPPFTRLANLVIAAPREEDASRAAGVLRKTLEDIFPEELSLKGPAPCPFSLYKGMHRWHVTAVSPAGFPLEDPIREGVSQFRKSMPSSGLRLLVDMDPISLL
ncbi:MAG: primosomal protein N' [Armatimonadetes bacterium]|nr:primosomal protein N' [Armatimonadota bacterium]